MFCKCGVAVWSCYLMFNFVVFSQIEEDNSIKHSVSVRFELVYESLQLA